MAKTLGTIFGVFLAIVTCIITFLISSDIRSNQLPIKLRKDIIDVNKLLPMDVSGGAILNKISVDGLEVTFSISSDNYIFSTLNDEEISQQLEVIACTYRFNYVFNDASEDLVIIVQFNNLDGDNKYYYKNTFKQCIDNSVIIG